METAADYRQYASDCLRLAKVSQVQNSKTILLEMAQRWFELADKLECEGRQRTTVPEGTGARILPGDQ